MRKLKEKIDVAIKSRKRLEQELEERDERIGALLKDVKFFKEQAAKVEGLIDENIKQANKIEELLADIEEANRQMAELVD